MADSETKELRKVLQKQLESTRAETKKGLDALYASAQETLRTAKSDSEADKKARKEATATAAKALKARQSLDKQELTWRTDLNKNFKDIGSTITGGIEGMFGEAFGPLGGIAATLTTGFFKRSQENKKNVEMNQAQVDTGEMIVQDAKDKENEEKKKKKIETNKGEVQEDTAESAEETAGGISDTVAELDYTNQWLDLIEGHLDFISANTLTLEDQREMARGRGGVPAKKKVKGKKDDEFSWLELGGTILGAITGALMGAVAGLTVGFLNMWKNIFKFIGGKLAKMFPNVTKMLGDIFGKGGKLSNFFTSIKTFFTQNKAFKVVSDLIDTVKGAIAKALKPIKAAFTSIKTGFTSFFKSIKGAFKMITGPIDSIKKMLGVGAKTGGGGMGFLKSFKTFFKIFKTFFAKLFLPLQVIISLVEGFFEAKDAVDKSEGMMATFFNAIVGFFGGILDGLIFGMLDLVKDGIAWVAGFLGFGDVEDSLNSFSFSAMFNEFLDDIYAWFNTLFSDPLAALGQLWSGLTGAAGGLIDLIISPLKSAISWLLGIFGFEEAAANVDNFSLSGMIGEAFDKVIAWFTGIFAWGKAAGATEEGGWSFLTFVDTIWTNVKDWLIGLFTWGKEAGATEEGGWSLLTFVDSVWTKVKEWFTGIFSWASTEEEGDSWVVKTAKNVLKGVKEWFGSMFKFDSASDLLSTGLNIMMWIPNLFVKAIAGITSWFAGILGFDEASKNIAKAGKEFSFGDLIMKAVKAIGKWFGDMFDSITNFDFAGFAKGIMPDFLADMIFGDDAKTEKTAETKKAEAAKKEIAGGEKEVESSLGLPDFSSMNPWPMVREKINSLMNPDDAPWGTGDVVGWMRDKLLAVLPTGEPVQTGKDGGFIVSRPTYLPSSGVVVGEHPTWPGKNGFAGGGAGQKEMIVPFQSGEGQAALGQFSKSVASAVGASLNQSAMDKVGLTGPAGMGSAPTVVDTSTQQIITNNTIVNSPEPTGPMLPGAGRDTAVSHFRHVA